MNTYDPADLYNKKKRKKNEKPKKEKPAKEEKPAQAERNMGHYGLVMFLAVMVLLLGICIVENIDENKLPTGDGFKISNPFISEQEPEEPEQYIGILEVHGTMSSDDSDLNYDQNWLLEQIDTMMYDPANTGLMLSIDTPGGSVYTVDELYLKIKEYQSVTARPVFTYMESMAASGGYYIAAPSNKIFANRNCWTGSIGVTIGTVYDITELLKNLGIKTVTITAGANKAMGTPSEPLTKEQQDIYQSLVDEAYSQFVDVVAEGRKMSREAVQVLADGRIYTAKQAQANGLIDAIGTRDEAVTAMKTEFALTSSVTRVFSYERELSIRNWLFGMSEHMDESAKSEYDQILELTEGYPTFSISYIANERN